MIGHVQLASLLCVRFSHDLSSLVGSLTGILDLIEETGAAAGEEITLAVETSRELTSRLQLLRAAWGGVADAIDPHGLATMMRGAIGSRKITLDTSGLAEEGLVQPEMARVMLNVVLLCIESLPGGGTITLTGEPADHVAVQIDGAGAAWPVGLGRCLVDEDYACSLIDEPRTIQAPLTALIARACGVRLSMMMGRTAQAPPPLLLAPAPNSDDSGA